MTNECQMRGESDRDFLARHTIQWIEHNGADERYLNFVLLRYDICTSFTPALNPLDFSHVDAYRAYLDLHMQTIEDMSKGVTA